ncbi:MAG TPA: MFS transporter [Mycobacteriales bacterium]|nr:MFS transporter [Mycobacteriales bacterium]
MTRGQPALLRGRNFRLLWIGETTSAVGNAVTVVALPLVAVATLHASTFTVGVLAASVWAPWLVLGLPAGAWVDRMPRRPVMLACDAVSALAFASVPVAAWLGVLGIAQLIAVALASGTSTVFFSVAYHTYLPTLVRAEDLVRGNAALQGSEAAAGVAGPGLGGLLAQAFGAVTGLLGDAVSFAASAACLLSIQAREPRRTVPGRRGTTLRREVGDGLRFVAGDRYLRVFALYGAVFNLIFNGVQALLVVFLVRVVGLDPGPVGLVFSGASLGGVAGAVVAGRLARRCGTARATLLLVLGGPPFGLLIPLATLGRTGLVVCVLGAAILVGGTVGDNIILGSFRQAYTPPELLGRVTASMRFVMHGTIPLGALLGGALGTMLGIRPALWVLLVSGAAVGSILLVGPIRKHRDLPAAPASSVPEPVVG